MCGLLIDSSLTRAPPAKGRLRCLRSRRRSRSPNTGIVVNSVTTSVVLRSGWSGMSNWIGRTCPVSADGSASNELGRSYVASRGFADRAQPHAGDLTHRLDTQRAGRQRTLHREEDEGRHGQGQRAGRADRHQRPQPQHHGDDAQLAEDAAKARRTERERHLSSLRRRGPRRYRVAAWSASARRRARLGL